MSKRNTTTISVGEAAKRLCVCEKTAYTYVHTGLIPSIRIGCRIVIPVRLFEERLLGIGGGDKAA